jgi:L-rhamnose-H+ transport protein
MSVLTGILLVILAGMGTGTMAWPLKTVRTFEFEHVWLVGMLFGLIVVPWAVVFLSIPDPVQMYREIDPALIAKSNAFAICWGIANVLLGVSYVRIGAALSGAILTGIGLCVGVILPFVFKASGVFSETPDLFSTPGLFTLGGVALILFGVLLSAQAGFARDRAKHTETQGGEGFLGGLIIIVIAGVLSAGISFAFIYAQGPIVAAMKSRGAGDIAATCAVWAAGLLGGAVVNIVYPAYLISKKHTWSRLFRSQFDLFISLLFGLQFIAAVVLLGQGMVQLGALGASVGFGIMQSIQILGNQAVGFMSGEWKGVHGNPRTLMILSIVVLVVAIVVMAFGNLLSAQLVNPR